jgi:ELMO domain-containing protein
MGMLGMENLLYFAKTDLARHVLSHSLHPVHGYTFAIVGINLTAFATRLLKTNLAKTHFYNLKRAPTLEDFHKFYCYLFFEFDRLWMDQKPTSIMDFSHIFREIFETNILSALDQEACLFKLNAVVESV